MAQMSQIQSGQQQQQINKMKIEELVADRKELNEFAIKLQDKGITPRQYMEMLRSSRDPVKQKTGIEGLMRLDEQDKFETVGKQLYPELFGATAPAAPVPSAMGQGAAPATQNALGVGMEPVNALAPAPAPAAAPVNALAAPAGKTPDQLRREIMLFSQSGDPRAKAMADMLKTQLADLSKTAPDAALMKQLGYPLTQAGFQAFRDAQRQERMLTPAEEAQRIRIANASRPPAQPRADSPLVAIVGPDGNPILVSRENAVGKPPANTAEKPMTQAQRVKYNKDKVSDKDVVTGAFAVTGELEKLTDELVGNPDKKIAPAPGLSSITGFSALTNPLALPSGDARKALQKLETFKGKIMALGRQLASQEGKLGNMAVQEWKFVSDAVQKIDPAAGNLDVQMRDVVRQAREYSQRQQSKYDDTYADDLTAPAKPALSPVDKQALEWANANSADPRAAAIKQRLGK
jgi:hypothetical protein